MGRAVGENGASEQMDTGAQAGDTFPKDCSRDGEYAIR